jgi:hypothetical protein
MTILNVIKVTAIDQDSYQHCMTKETYNRSLEKGEVQLQGFWSNVAHFGIVAYLLILPSTVFSFHLIGYFKNKAYYFDREEIWIIIIPIALSALLYWIQKRRLKFRVIKTKLNNVQLKEILIEVAKKLEWELISTTNDAYVATTNPSFFSGSWGEQITVLFH